MVERIEDVEHHVLKARDVRLRPGWIGVAQDLRRIRHRIAVQARREKPVRVSFNGGQRARPGVQDLDRLLRVPLIAVMDHSTALRNSARAVVSQLPISRARAAGHARDDGERGRLVTQRRAGFRAESVPTGQVWLGPAATIARIRSRSASLNSKPGCTKAPVPPEEPPAAAPPIPPAPPPPPPPAVVPPAPPAEPPPRPALAWPASGLPPVPGGPAGTPLLHAAANRLPTITRFRTSPEYRPSCPGYRRMEITPGSGGNSWNVRSRATVGTRP